MVGAVGWSAAAATYPPGQWVGEKKATVSPTATGGSLIIQSTGFIPGLQGRLNPIRDTLGRTYIYADNISINGSTAQPFSFELGKPMHAVDAAGHKFVITIIDILGRTTLLQYAKE
jgi:hypothetical protein